MSVLNQSGEEQVECPLCMEPLEVDDLHFYPCTCGYQICRFCWNRIREGENGLCPACRKAYPENPADFTPLSQEQVAAIKTEKKAREQKRRNKTLESRRALANVRVVQNNLVFVVGLPVRLADPEILKRQEYFGKYGKIHKVVINQSTTYAGSQGPSASAYVTYVTPADALRAIQGVNNVTLDGRVLKGSLGTTKYCAHFMRNQPCPKPDCMYLHELGDPKASFTKEEMHAGLHQVYERKLHNQLLAATAAAAANSATPTAQPPNSANSSSGNSSTNADKSSTGKEGNPSNFIPTTVVTSSHTNVVNSSKSNKKESSMNGLGSGNSSSSGSSVGSSSGKEAWPSLGSSPPNDSPLHTNHSVNKSQENGTSESSSPTLQTQQNQAQNNINNNNSKSKENDSGTKQNKNKENGTNPQSSKKSKNDKQKQKQSNSVSNSQDSEPEQPVDSKQFSSSQTNNTHSLFENDTQQYLSNELDELESDRHSLLENHDLLDNSDHSLLDDDNTHNLLNDANNEVIMMQRHREMLAGLVDNNHLLQMKNPLVNGYGLLERDMGFLGSDRQMSISQSVSEQKDLLLRERSRSELLMRQGDLLARQQHMSEHKPFMPQPSIGMDSASELLGANLYPNPQMLPPFGMRVNSELNTVGASSAGGAGAGAGAGGAVPFLHSLHSHQPQSVHTHMQPPMVNGFDAPQPTQSSGRYVAENMDKFFTDFRAAQQLRCGRDPRPAAAARNMIAAHHIEMEHKNRMNNMRGNENNMGHRAAGDGDDDLDFDPFKETQKALAEMMESEMMQNSVSSGDNVRRSRMAPPGFSHVSAYNLAMPRPHPQPHPHPQQHQHQGFNSSSAAMFSDWTQMDPAIMSTSVPSKAAISAVSAGAVTPQHHDLFARFNHLALHQPNGISKIQVPMANYGAMGLSGSVGAGSAVGVGGATWGAGSVPLPPGFAAPPHGMAAHGPHAHAHGPHSHAHGPHGPHAHHAPAECIDAK